MRTGTVSSRLQSRMLCRAEVQNCQQAPGTGSLVAEHYLQSEPTSRHSKTFVERKNKGMFVQKGEMAFWSYFFPIKWLVIKIAVTHGFRPTAHNPDRSQSPTARVQATERWLGQVWEPCGSTSQASETVYPRLDFKVGFPALVLWKNWPLQLHFKFLYYKLIFCLKWKVGEICKI